MGIKILIHDMGNKEAALEIQKFCFINNVTPKIQISRLTEKVLYQFNGVYPKDLEGVEYEDA